MDLSAEFGVLVRRRILTALDHVGRRSLWNMARNMGSINLTSWNLQGA